MPQRVREYTYSAKPDHFFCANCQEETPDVKGVHIEAGYHEIVAITGPGWELVLDEEWLCSPQCLLARLFVQIKAAIRAPDQRCSDGSAAEWDNRPNFRDQEEYASDWPGFCGG